MARRRSAASRSSSSSRRSPGTGSPRPGARTRSDGKVDVSCPQCGAGYRLPETMLDDKLECTECHRVFFPKTTAGKRVQAPDYTKVYVGFGVLAVLIVAVFVMMGGKEPPKKPKPQPTVQTPTHSVGTHPRAQALVAWGQAIGAGNPLVMNSHSDVPALSRVFGCANDLAAVTNALQTHELTRFLRELQCSSGALSSDADMTADSGSGILYVTPKPGDDSYTRGTRGELVVTFRMEGTQLKVTGLEVKMKPVWNIEKARPGTVTYTPNEDIAKPTVTEVSDSAGTRKVRESEPAPVPHWSKATPEQRAMADQVVADIVTSASPEAPGALFNRAVDKVRTMEQKQTCVPRVLNAMYERYGDVNAHNLELSQLDRALRAWTGYAVNYTVADSSDKAKDKQERESCVRQWFAFWYRYHEDLSEFFDTSDPLEEGGDDKKK